MADLRPIVPVLDLVAFASGSSSLIDAAEDPSAREFDVVQRALVAAEAVGVNYLRWPADAPGLRVHYRREVLFSHGRSLDGALFYPSVRPAVQYGDESSFVYGTASGDLLAVKSARPYADHLAKYYAGYRGTEETLEQLQEVPGLNGLETLPPELPPALVQAVAETAIAVAVRIDSGLIGKRETAFNTSTMVRTSLRLEQGAIREIWDTYAQGFRVPVL